jgi:hypothetical protein
MSEHYSHLLIPDSSIFVPQTTQVVAFLEGLDRLGSAPLESTIQISKLPGKVRTGRDAFTGETITIPTREFVTISNLSSLSVSLKGLDNYEIYLTGHGPAEFPPFKLYVPSDSMCQSEFKSAHSYEVICNLRKATVSLSENSWMEPCTSECNLGVFRNPWRKAEIKVPKAGCARFWIELRFGNWLVPKIDKNLDLLSPSILKLAKESLETSFAQGCSFG